MIPTLNNVRTKRRLSAGVLLFVWIWCLAIGTFAMAMSMDEMAAMEAGQTSLAPESMSATASHSLGELDPAQDLPSATSECCPEESHFVGQYVQSSLFMAVLSFFFILVLFSRQAAAFRFFARRLIPLPPVRLHALHCSYLN